MVNNVSRVTAKRCTAVQELRVRNGGQGREARMQKCMGLMWSGKTWVEQQGRCAGDLKRGFCTSSKQIRSMMQDMVMCMWLTKRKAKIRVAKRHEEIRGRHKEDGLG